MATTEKRIVNGVDVTALEGAIDGITADADVGQYTFRVATEWQNALKSVTTINEFDQAGETIHTQEFTLEGDEPDQILGDRTAPNAVEVILAALGSCLSVGYAAHAAGMGIEIDDLRFEMEGDIDLRGFLGIADDVRPGYDDIVCTAYIDADASESEITVLREQVESTSPVMDIIQSTVPLTTDLVIE